MTRDLPITFSGPMIRALRAGRKTQTRRLLAPGKVVEDISSEAAEDYELRGWEIFRSKDDALCAANYPHDPGDRLYVREAWRAPGRLDRFSPADMIGHCVALGGKGGELPVRFEADGARTWPDEWGDGPDNSPGRLRASMHLPRAFSRLWLEVTDVRVERLQEISDADALAEGIFEFRRGKWWYADDQPNALGSWTPRNAYACLWDSLNAPRAPFDSDPFVVVIAFAPHAGNIDAEAS